MKNRVLLGTGVFGFPQVERRSDRYGTCFVEKDGTDECVLVGKKGRSLEGRSGRLVAEVVEARETGHIGDLHRRIYPRGCAAGETVVLGEGELFIEHRGQGSPHEKGDLERDDEKMFEALESAFAAAGVRTQGCCGGGCAAPQEDEEPMDLIGVRPADGRDSDWLDPQKVYNLYESVVRLYFEAD